MGQASEAYVVDASVIVKWFLTDEEFSEQALAIWRRQTSDRTVLAAPAHIYLEASNAVVSATRYSPPRISTDFSRTLVHRILRARFVIVPTEELIATAFELTIQHRITIYDALYVALAADYSLPLVTADRGLYRNTRHDHDVRWLGDFPSN
jgi:predicted nucleic acid-binding protein